jgi:DNA-binding NarL/FixJ family response regulator
MPVRIAVLDPLPLFRRGIAATLGEFGVIVEAPDDVDAWSREETRTIFLLTLQAEADWHVLTRLRQELSDPIIVALLADASTMAYVRALSGGAATAVSRDATPEQLRQVLEQVVRGVSLLPLHVVHALGSSGLPSREATDVPPPREIEWLRELARGTTVARLAERAGYSERAMFRLLKGLYRQMGVKTRTEALIRAHQENWL